MTLRQNACDCFLRAAESYMDYNRTRPLPKTGQTKDPKNCFYDGLERVIFFTSHLARPALMRGIVAMYCLDLIGITFILGFGALILQAIPDAIKREQLSQVMQKANILRLVPHTRTAYKKDLERRHIGFEHGALTVAIAKRFKVLYDDVTPTMKKRYWDQHSTATVAQFFNVSNEEVTLAMRTEYWDWRGTATVANSGGWGSTQGNTCTENKYWELSGIGFLGLARVALTRRTGRVPSDVELKEELVANSQKYTTLRQYCGLLCLAKLHPTITAETVLAPVHLNLIERCFQRRVNVLKFDSLRLTRVSVNPVELVFRSCDTTQVQESIFDTMGSVMGQFVWLAAVLADPPSVDKFPLAFTGRFHFSSIDHALNLFDVILSTNISVLSRLPDCGITPATDRFFIKQSHKISWTASTFPGVTSGTPILLGKTLCHHTATGISPKSLTVR
ncbi:hypothetical protein PLICRDRAFT_25814 [Plicaturopsis crispa FD-325 SS-3]|nr:hypothetical protein PLICRDRAFT_25814 [Plicaturopsis crispa FD-325 SS-3]